MHDNQQQMTLRTASAARDTQTESPLSYDLYCSPWYLPSIHRATARRHYHRYQRLAEKLDPGANNR